MRGVEGLGTFGRYLLVEELAAGGMGQVYRAMLRGGPGFEKEVALKRVLRELGEDDEFVMRFGDEARIASTLSHGNIVQVFDFGEHEGEFYLAMEFVDGPDLGTLLQAAHRAQQPVPRPAALYIAAEFCRGLAAAHQRRDARGKPTPVVHRDVSPQNIIVSRAGEVKVTDFGIAKAADNALRTKTGMLMGKVRYMAPEQARAEGVDARADVFAAGCVLFEMLAGRPLFDGPTPESVLLAVVQSPIPRISQVATNVPDGLDAILERALDREREHRYADGAALARDLERLLHVIAPAFSRDDLAALVRALVPPALRAEQLPTREIGTGAALAAHPTLVDPPETGAERPAAARSLDELRGSADPAYAAAEPPKSAGDGRASGVRDVTALADAALRAELDAALAPVPESAPSVAAPPSVAAIEEPAVELHLGRPPTLVGARAAESTPASRGEPTAAGRPERQPRSTRWLWPLLLAVLLGGGGAAMAALLVPQPGPLAAPSGTLARGGSVQLAGHRLTLREARRLNGASERLLLVLSLKSASAVPTTKIASSFLLGRGHQGDVLRIQHARRPLLWQIDGKGRLRLAFRYPVGKGPLLLGLQAVGQPAHWLRLEL